MVVRPRQFDRTFRRLSKALAAKEKGENVEGETAISLVENTGVRGGPVPEEDETSRDAALKNDESNQSWMRDQDFAMDEGERPSQKTPPKRIQFSNPVIEGNSESFILNARSFQRIS